MLLPSIVGAVLLVCVTPFYNTYEGVSLDDAGAEVLARNANYIRAEQRRLKDTCEAIVHNGELRVPRYDATDDAVRVYRECLSSSWTLLRDSDPLSREDHAKLGLGTWVCSDVYDCNDRTIRKWYDLYYSKWNILEDPVQFNHALRVLLYSIRTGTCVLAVIEAVYALYVYTGLPYKDYRTGRSREADSDEEGTSELERISAERIRRRPKECVPEWMMAPGGALWHEYPSG